MYHVDNEIQTEHFILTDVDKLKIKKRLLILIFFFKLHTWTSIDRRLLRAHHDLAAVLLFAYFATHKCNKGAKSNQPKNTSNYSAYWNDK